MFIFHKYTRVVYICWLEDASIPSGWRIWRPFKHTFIILAHEHRSSARKKKHDAFSVFAEWHRFVSKPRMWRWGCGVDVPRSRMMPWFGKEVAVSWILPERSLAPAYCWYEDGRAGLAAGWRLAAWTRMLLLRAESKGIDFLVPAYWRGRRDWHVSWLRKGAGGARDHKQKK